MIRKVGNITYNLIQKNIKGVYLRVNRDLSVSLSANRRVSLKAIDEFVKSREEYIEKTRAKLSALPKVTYEDKWTHEECLKYFNELSLKYYPLFSWVLPSPPEIKVRLMKSRWGVCNIRKKTITMNKALMCCPKEAAEYVMLHEYVHFVHPNHQKGFHDMMKKLMPDYKERRKMLGVL